MGCRPVTYLFMRRRRGFRFFATAFLGAGMILTFSISEAATDKLSAYAYEDTRRLVALVECAAGRIEVSGHQFFRRADSGDEPFGGRSDVAGHGRHKYLGQGQTEALRRFDRDGLWICGLLLSRPDQLRAVSRRNGRVLGRGAAIRRNVAVFVPLVAAAYLRDRIHLRCAEIVWQPHSLRKNQ